MAARFRRHIPNPPPNPPPAPPGSPGVPRYLVGNSKAQCQQVRRRATGHSARGNETAVPGVIYKERVSYVFCITWSEHICTTGSFDVTFRCFHAGHRQPKEYDEAMDGLRDFREIDGKAFRANDSKPMPRWWIVLLVDTIQCMTIGGRLTTSQIETIHCSVKT